MSKKDEALKLALEGAANYIDALGGDSRKYRQALAEQPAQQQEPVGSITVSHYKGLENHEFDYWGSLPDGTHNLYTSPPAQHDPVKLRRGDILRCIETDELCTVWSTSTTGRTLVKWSANDFGNYTAEQIGELFWLEPEPDDLELAAEKSDNYAAFHAGYRFSVARGNTGDNT